MQILQITDPHLYGNADAQLRGVQTDASLRAVLDDAFTEIADYAAILVTGDLVQDDASGYLRFRSIFGNHDEPEAMRRSLNAAPFQICGTRKIRDWHFIMLDSYDPGHVGGRLSDEELERLDRALAGAPAHALVCLHHHPIAMGSRWLDSIGLANSDEFWRIIDSHAHVRAVVWGHVHQNYEGSRGKVRLFATPSTGAQFLPNSDRYAVDSLPPAYRRFELHGDGRIDSAIRWVQPVQMQQSAAG
jgi:Icc protein